MAPGAQAKPLVWLHGAIKTPPFSQSGRVEAGVLLRRLQDGEHVGMLHGRPMPSIGTSCHELRVRDSGYSWRIVYFVDENAIVILEVFPKKTRTTPVSIVETCQKRLAAYRRARTQERNK